MERNKADQKKKNSKGKWYFLLFAVVSYLLVYFISNKDFVPIWDFFVKLILQVLPVFLLVYILMVLINYFVNNKILKKYLGEEAGVRGWIIAIVTGIISMGPVYMWYPVMRDLQDKGIKNKFLAAFLYNRGIKLQWAPLLIVYFGWTYSLTLLIVMAVFSIPQGIIVEKLTNHHKIKRKGKSR